MNGKKEEKKKGIMPSLVASYAQCACARAMFAPIVQKDVVMDERLSVHCAAFGRKSSSG